MSIKISTLSLMALIIGLLLISLPGKSQVVTGQQGIDLQAGKSDVGFIIHAGYIYFLSEKISIKGEGFFEGGNPYQFTYHNFGIAALFRYNVINLNNVILVTPFAGLTANYDHISPVKKQYSAGTNYGGRIGLEAEAALTEKFSFVASFNQLLLLQKPFGNQRLDYGLGVRFYIGN